MSSLAWIVLGVEILSGIVLFCGTFAIAQ